MREYWESFKLWILSVNSTWFFLGFSIADFLRVPTIIGFVITVFFVMMIIDEKRGQS